MAKGECTEMQSLGNDEYAAYLPSWWLFVIQNETKKLIDTRIEDESSLGSITSRGEKRRPIYALDYDDAIEFSKRVSTCSNKAKQSGSEFSKQKHTEGETNKHRFLSLNKKTRK